MSGPLGLLFVQMAPPPGLETEFNHWYDTEAIPQRAAVPGFLCALRADCVIGDPRYLAWYDLESPKVLESPGYLAIAYENYSPRTKEILKVVPDLRRNLYVQRWPGREETPQRFGCTTVLSLDFAPSVESEAIEWIEQTYMPALKQVPGLLSARWFSCLDKGPKHLILCHLQRPDVVLSEAWRAFSRPHDRFAGNLERVVESLYVPHQVP